jgi:hypothetical protein
MGRSVATGQSHPVDGLCKLARNGSRQSLVFARWIGNECGAFRSNYGQTRRKGQLWIGTDKTIDPCRDYPDSRSVRGRAGVALSFGSYCVRFVLHFAPVLSPKTALRHIKEIAG